MSVGAVIDSFQTGPWNVGSTWVGGVVPDMSMDTAQIQAGHKITIPNGLTVALAYSGDDFPLIGIGAGAELEVASGGVLSVGQASSVTNSGTFTLEAGGILNLSSSGQLCHGAPGAPGTSTLAGTVNIAGAASCEYRVDVQDAYCEVSGAVNVTAGKFSAYGVDVEVVVKSGGAFTLGASGNLKVRSGGLVTFESGSSLTLAGGKIDGVQGAGGGYIHAAITITGSGTIDWASGDFGMNAGLNLTSCTHLNTTGATLVCDVAGTFNLGGDATGLTVSTAGLVGTVQCQRNEKIHALNHVAGTLDLNGKTIECSASTWIGGTPVPAMLVV